MVGKSHREHFGNTNNLLDEEKPQGGQSNFYCYRYEEEKIQMFNISDQNESCTKTPGFFPLEIPKPAADSY